MNVEEYIKAKQSDGNIHTLSMGAGHQTTAILLKLHPIYKHVIFADTGDEHPLTYEYIDKYLKPFCQEHNLEWTRVTHKAGKTLMEWCMDRKILPIIARRWCTEDFKIKPINKFIRSIGATKDNPVYSHIGISMDESHRAKFSHKDPRYVKRAYPLLDLKLKRADCDKIILDHGWPLPPKSGCDFCPFQRRSRLRAYAQEYPERFKEIVAMEKNERNYPRRPLMGKYTLDGMLNSSKLTDFDDDSDDLCDDGYCMR